MPGPHLQDRVQGVAESQAGWLTRLLYRAFRKRMRVVPKSKTLAAYHTPTLLASSWMDAVNAGARTLSPTLKELAQLKAAAMIGCPF
jgi:hypothetical protein